MKRSLLRHCLLCKHAEIPEGSVLRCNAFEYPVTTLRARSDGERCGPEGVWWEKKPAQSENGEFHGDA